MPTVGEGQGDLFNPACKNCTKFLDPKENLSYCVIIDNNGTEDMRIVECNEEYEKFYTLEDCEYFFCSDPEFVSCRCFELCFIGLNEEEEQQYIEDSLCSATVSICRP